MNRGATRSGFNLQQYPAAVRALKVGLVLGVLYICGEAIGFKTDTFQFGDTWKFFLVDLPLGVVREGNFPERFGLAVIGVLLVGCLSGFLRRH